MDNYTGNSLVRGEGWAGGEREQTNPNIPAWLLPRPGQGLPEEEGAGLGGAGAGELLPEKGQCPALICLPRTPIPGPRTWVPTGRVSRQLWAG